MQLTIQQRITLIVTYSLSDVIACHGVKLLLGSILFVSLSLVFV